MATYAEENLLTQNMVQNQDSMIDQQFRIILLIQNSIKAYVYLISWYLTDISRLKETKEIQTKQRKKNQNKTRDQQNNEQEINAIMISQKECLRQFILFIEQKLHYFWPDHRIEEDFINLFLNACFVMLENPNNIKNSEVKDMIFDLL